ncbi:hypothetical protein [Streptomyces sp. GESEQ-35]|uniref:hypothetical protein n=1 Tax=Streptomyces sp. GESEQ-35 TaxID=2812657 RepID=UPI001B32B107|nr:hypothetical protein [Streptomyces sp. GESEQ-35]
MHRATRSGRLMALCLAVLLLPGCGSGGSTPRPDHDRTRTAAPCPGVNVSGSDEVATFYRALAEPVYRAACAGDGRRLAQLIDTGSGGAQHFETNACQGCDGNEIVAMWRDEYGLDLAELARLLETPPRWSQGGPTYVRGNHLASLNRGWSGVPAFWSSFFPDCRAEESCQMYAEIAGSP